MGAMIFKKSHLFLGKSDKDQLQKLVDFFGWEEYQNLAEKLELVE